MKTVGKKRVRLVFTLSLAVLLVAPLAATKGRADDGEDSVFCAWAQQVVAGTQLRANVVTQTAHEAFVKSKSSDSPLTVQQYWSNPVAGDGSMPRVVSCKMRTAERINSAYPTADSGKTAAAGDESCAFVHRTVLASVLNGIPREQLAIPAETLRVDEDEMTYMGPLWLKPWPFEPLYRDDEGLLHLRTRALNVPFAWWIPMPDRFKGNHYCHLIAPDYLEAVLRGSLSPGV